MNYKNFSDTQSERAQINDKIINSYTPEEEIGVTILDEKQEKKLKKKLKNKAFDHYKQHGNLNELIYSTNNQEVKKKLEKWMEKFYLNYYEEKKNLTKEVEGEEIKNQIKQSIDMQSAQEHNSFMKNVSKSSQSLKIHFASIFSKKRNEKKKMTNYDLTTFKKSLNIPIREEDEDRELLDFDDSVEMELPKDFTKIHDEDLLNHLGNKLHKVRDNCNTCKNEYNNDDFLMLIELLKNKKKLYMEQNPYYIERYSFTREMLFDCPDYGNDDNISNKENVDDFIIQFLN